MVSQLEGISLPLETQTFLSPYLAVLRTPKIATSWPLPHSPDWLLKTFITPLPSTLTCLLLSLRATGNYLALCCIIRVIGLFVCLFLPIFHFNHLFMSVPKFLHFLNILKSYTFPIRTPAVICFIIILYCVHIYYVCSLAQIS